MGVFDGYRLTSPFGYRIHPVYKTKKFHKGVDLVTPKANDPIYAFTSGEVFHAEEGAQGSGFGNYGIVVAIKDDKGYLHCYAHLSKASVKVGDRVSKGQKIGHQGSTGISTGPHLHYEIRKKVAPSFGFTSDQSGVVEPTKYLEDYYGSSPVSKKEVEDDMEDIVVYVNGKAEKGIGKLHKDGRTFVQVASVKGKKIDVEKWDNKTKTLYIKTE